MPMHKQEIQNAREIYLKSMKDRSEKIKSRLILLSKYRDNLNNILSASVAEISGFEGSTSQKNFKVFEKNSAKPATTLAEIELKVADDFIYELRTELKRVESSIREFNP